jgi:Xaa-Pro aminopeptidase
MVFEEDPSSRVEEVHAAVLEAQRRARETVSPGVEAREVDRVARELLQKRLGHEMVHSTGHGIGLQVHERPGLSEESSAELEPGNVVTVEPGVYLDEFGVRIEDSVVVTEEGCRSLNSSPRDLRA